MSKTIIEPHEKISISIKEKNLKLIDKTRGLATRSAYFDFLVEQSISKNGKK